MKLRGLIIGLLYISVSGSAQGRFDWKSHIDFVVSQSDSLFLQSQTTFHLQKYLKNDQPYKETWHFTTQDGKVVVFQVHYLIENTEYTETYYLDHGQLICLEELEAPFLAYYVDDIKKGQLFFLVDNSLRQYVTYGYHNEQKVPDAETACLQKFKDRYTELQKNLPVLPR